MNNDNVKLPASGSVWRKGGEWRKVTASCSTYVAWQTFDSGSDEDGVNDWLAWAADAEEVSGGGE